MKEMLIFLAGEFEAEMFLLWEYTAMIHTLVYGC